MTGLGDHELRQRIARLRAADESRAPAFDQIYARAQASRARPRRRSPVVVGTALATAAAVLLCVRVRPDPAPLASIESITDWRASTDVLLPTSLPTLFGPMQPLGASVVDSLAR